MERENWKTLNLKSRLPFITSDESLEERYSPLKITALPNGMSLKLASKTSLTSIDGVTSRVA